MLRHFIESASNAQPQRRLHADWLVGAVLGAVLLTAGAMKARQVAVTAEAPAIRIAALSPPAPLVISAECILGLWFLSGIRREKSRLAALGCFALFAGVSLSSAVTGERSCGCFGDAEISPLATASFDLAAVGALLCIRKSGRRNSRTPPTPVSAEAAL